MRQFLALDLPRVWREALDERRRRLAPRANGWRWPGIDAVHLTLRFLGEVDPALDATAREVWRDAVRGHAPFELQLDAPGRFPARGRPRILWVGVRRSRPLEALAAAFEGAARDIGFEPETREFRPHLTLGRARPGGRVTLPDDLDEPLSAPPFAVSEVILFRSVLHPAGARYTALERYTLEAG